MSSAYWDCSQKVFFKSEGDEYVEFLFKENLNFSSKPEITLQDSKDQLISSNVSKDDNEESESNDEGLLELSPNEDMQAKAGFPDWDTLNKEEFSSGPSKSTDDTEEDQKHNSTNSENTEGMDDSTSLPFEGSKENNESPHRYRPDNMIRKVNLKLKDLCKYYNSLKAGFRGLIGKSGIEKLNCFPLLSPCIQMAGRKFKEDISKFQGVNLKKHPSKNLSVLYELLKSTYEQALGHAISEKDFFKVYGILLKLSISTKERREVLNSYGNTLRESALSNCEEFIYHRSHYTIEL